MNKFSGFLLSYFKYGENDAVLHCFTLENGFQSFFLKGVYSAKNKKKAYLAPLNELLITVVDKKKISDLHLVSKIECLDDILPEYNVKVSSLAFFVSDFLHQVLRNEQANTLLYQEIKEMKLLISDGDTSAHYTFLIRLLKIFGISPLLQDGNFLNIEKAEFQKFSEENGPNDEVSLIWRMVLEEKFTPQKIKKESRKILLDSIIFYYKIHFPDFHTPKSLAILTQVFE
ncbi:hypothetical protein GCM10010992_16200 [Cloacibacterium rupense]|uniref:DNA replication/recombination mediator RecO N-terminal domain-containing protein n=1 Tax=Cloacibacterium rupense TaxID=517423 RepID=A0ABQ2NIM8_9FLAO|nr:recombination protein O N-terminal domain-containing protein [Cloacibacterium rupense]GGP04348.1 hypothetical protein GCM10010992_16200 [Cloacibacterium rupense]